MDAARAIELTISEMTFIKENSLNPEVNRLSHDTFAGQKDKHEIKPHATNATRKIISL